MKKNMKRNIIIILSAMVTGFSSCSKWLDIKPQTEIESDVVFEKESGFQDALTGVYLTMTGSALYGQELSFGMLDVLAGQYANFSQVQTYYSASTYNYEEENFISQSNSAFENAYNAIADLNNLIVNINAKGPSLFSGSHYHVIRGEAYGLRALLHFDMVRLYGSSMAAQGQSALAIPYVDTIGLLPKPRLTTQQVLDRVLADLEIAANELRQGDPIVPGNEDLSTTYLRDRNYKLNYYAAKALQARVYLYAGNRQQALLAAQEVIESNVFGWTPSGQIANASETIRNKVFTQELIFELNINTLGTRANGFFDPSNPSEFLPFRDIFPAIFETESDYRSEYLTVILADNSRRYSIKLTQPAGMSLGYVNRMPMLRKSEVYYIAAECLAADNGPQAVAYLNEVRTHRNLGELSPELSESAIQDEIALEYRREFFNEGQLFFYYKRKNVENIAGVPVAMNERTYVLPLPDNEITYGQ